jgi:glycosyltransferase involved in cell wall biosynthesis
MDKTPLVSAVVTTRNRPELLVRALDSIAEQTYSNLELVVVDDGSEPAVRTIVESYGGVLPVLYHRNETAVGACRARNQGIKKASGKFVAGLDDDDSWHKDRILALVKAYSNDYACVTSDTLMVHAKREAVWKKKKVIDLNTLLFTNQVGNQVLVRRDRLIEIGGFDEDLVAAQDYDLWVRLSSKYGPIKNVQKPLQTIFMDHNEDRITERSSFRGYLQFYNKHKHRFNRSQRKYQLYKIRRAQQKQESVAEFINYVPAFRYWKELKRILKERFWT